MELTFKQFLCEQDQEDLGIDEIKHFVRTVVKDCQPYLNQFGFGLFRGMQATSPIVYHKEVHKSRRPRDTPNGIHQMIDIWFKQNFGHYYRSESIFVKNSLEGVEAYGTPYIVFPIGNFSILYSAEYPDLWVNVSSHLIPMLEDQGGYSREEAKRIATAEFIENIPEQAKPIINQWLEEGEFTIAKTKQELHKWFGEKMVLCDQYHAINAHVLENVDLANMFIQAMKER